MKIHLIGLAHTKTSPKFLTCAYTQKVWKLAHMLVKLGYDVMHYGTEGADVPCKHIDVLSDAMWLFIGERKWRHMEGYLHVGAFLARTINLSNIKICQITLSSAAWGIYT